MSSALNFKKNVERVLEENRRRGKAPNDRLSLAKLLGVHPPQVSMALRGKSSPNLETVDRFAKALSVTAADLISEEVPPVLTYEHDISECLTRIARKAGLEDLLK